MVMIMPPMTEGSQAREEPLIKDADGSSLEFMYRTIGDNCRCIECVSLGHGLDMWVDEEARLKSDPVLNVPATNLARAMTGRRYTIYGTAVIACHDADGNTVDITKEADETLKIALVSSVKGGLLAALLGEPNGVIGGVDTGEV